MQPVGPMDRRAFSFIRLTGLPARGTDKRQTPQMDKKKLGFGGQFVEGINVGTHVDSDGDPIKVSALFLQKLIDNYDPQLHEAPAVIGHPKENAPAYGWVSGLRVRDGKLETQFSQVDPKFEEIVKNGY